MSCGQRVYTNTFGVPYLRTRGVRVSDEAVDYALGFGRIDPVGQILINVADAIPEGTTGTLPVRFTMNGTTRTLTYYGDAAVTAADLVGTGDIEVSHNFFTGTLQLLSPLAPSGA